MDILGKEGEEAKENVQRVSTQLESLESHLNAVDSALQDFMDNSQKIMAEDMALQESEVQQIDRLDQENRNEERSIAEIDNEMDRMKRQIKSLQNVQRKQSQQLDLLMDSELLDIIDRVRDLVNTTNKRYYDLRDALKKIENRLNELENDFIMEVNNREYDFEKKVDKREYEDETEELENEISKLRASFSVLSNDVDELFEKHKED